MRSTAFMSTDASAASAVREKIGATSAAKGNMHTAMAINARLMKRDATALRLINLHAGQAFLRMSGRYAPAREHLTQ
jgi:hypothetical protein